MTFPSPPLRENLDVSSDKPGELDRLLGRLRVAFGKAFSEWFNQIYIVLFANRQFGPTGSRPTKQLWIGRRYYDTTLNKPVWVNAITPAIVWKDAAGTTV